MIKPWKAQYTEPEKRHAAHILLTKAKEGGDDASLNALAEDLIQQIKNGGDFAALALEYSADPGSADKGGDLGWFGRGVMVPEFDQAVFSANDGDVLGPIKTNFGVHIIKIMGIQPETIKAFADVKTEVHTAWMAKERQALFDSELAQLDSLTFENPENLTVASSQLNLTVETSGFFTRDNTRRLGALDKSTIADAAFSDQVLFEDKNSPVVELKPTDVVVLRKAGYEEPKLEAFDEVKDGIKERLALEKAAQQAHTNAEAWLAELNSGVAPSALKVGSLTWVNEAKTNRYNLSVPPEVLDEAFRLHFDGSKKTVTGMLPIAQKDYVIVMVNGKYDGVLDPAMAQEMGADYMQGVLGYKGQLDYQLYTLQAQKDSDVDMVEMKM
jgi:peptidyl-prolyl cis-trans isomerase D